MYNTRTPTVASVDTSTEATKILVTGPPSASVAPQDFKTRDTTTKAVVVAVTAVHRLGPTASQGHPTATQDASVSPQASADAMESLLAENALLRQVYMNEKKVASSERASVELERAERPRSSSRKRDSSRRTFDAKERHSRSPTPTRGDIELGHGHHHHHHHHDHHSLGGVVGGGELLHSGAVVPVEGLPFPNNTRLPPLTIHSAENAQVPSKGSPRSTSKKETHSHSGKHQRRMQQMLEVEREEAQQWVGRAVWLFFIGAAMSGSIHGFFAVPIGRNHLVDSVANKMYAGLAFSAGALLVLTLTVYPLMSTVLNHHARSLSSIASVALAVLLCFPGIASLSLNFYATVVLLFFAGMANGVLHGLGIFVITRTNMTDLMTTALTSGALFGSIAARSIDAGLLLGVDSRFVPWISAAILTLPSLPLQCGPNPNKQAKNRFHFKLIINQELHYSDRTSMPVCKRFIW